MTLTLDHILWAAPDLDRASHTFQAITGITPSVGGSHPGFGTRNKLVGLGEELFFEIIAPDPAQAENGHRSNAIAGLPAPEMHAFCLRTDGFDGLAEAADRCDIEASEPVAMSRTRPDGVTLNWEICYLGSPQWGRALPFLIDWKGSPHPATTSVQGCRLTEFAVLHPRAPELAAVFAEMGIATPVIAAPDPGFLARLSTPKGEVVFT